MLPKIKKSIKSFLLNEDGKISKETLLTIGSLLGIAALGVLETKEIKAQCGSCSGSSGSTTSGGCESCGASGSCGAGGSGCDGCEGCACSCTCFPAGTKIALADGTTKNIEDIKIGDIILAYDTFVNKEAHAKVLELDSPIRCGYYNLNNSLLRITDDHPMYTRKKSGIIGWTAINPVKSLKTYKIGYVNQLEIGDEMFTRDKGWVKITSIKYVKGHIKTYNLKNIEGYDTFFADGVLVLKIDAVLLEKEIAIEVSNNEL